MAPTDAAHDPVMRAQFQHLLDLHDPPNTFKPTDLVLLLSDADLRRMGYEKAEEALPAVYELAFEMKEFGACELLQKGKVLGEDATLLDLKGPVRIRRLAEEW